MAKLQYNEILPKRTVIMEGDPFLVLTSNIAKKDRQKASNNVKMKNLRSGGVVDKTFHQADVLDEAFLGRQVKYIVLIDPRRHHKYRAFANFICCWRKLNELEQLILKNDFARRHRKVPANLKCRGIGLANFHEVFRPVHVRSQKRDAINEILSVGPERLAQHFGVRCEKV